MKYAAHTIIALVVSVGCIRDRRAPAADAGLPEALRANPGRQVASPGDLKPDAAAVAPAPTPEREATAEETLRRCAPEATGAVIRVGDELAYTLAGPVARAARRFNGQFVCERYEAAADAARSPWPGGSARGRVVLATSAGGAPGSAATALMELDADGAALGMAVMPGVCAPGSTVRPLRLFPGAPALLVRCWLASDAAWTAVDHVIHRGPQGWRALASSESGRIVRSPTMSAPPANPTLPGSIRVAEVAEAPRLEVATSSFDPNTGSTKFVRQSLRWSAESDHFVVDPAPAARPGGGT
jgi:hypothetical protein